LMQLTMELDDRVVQRAAELEAANETLAQTRIAALNLMEDAIVARKETEQTNVQLEQRVHDRTAQLEAANKELEAFSYSVSHDLRSPLHCLMGAAELLQQGTGSSLSETDLEHVKTISRSAGKMRNLIEDLLGFAHIGKTAMQKTDVDLDALVWGTLDEFKEDTKGRKIVWKIDPLPTVLADRALLRMVLVNLISNAVKFTSIRAEARIEIGCGRGSATETVMFIRDNGAGFDQQYAGKLFGVFQRLHAQDEFAGTGIGLANVQRIIKRHGGRVWAEGVVDGGATFYFSIPKKG